MAPYPEWLHILAWTYIFICLICALGLAVHTLVRPQKMAVMELVWPITALYMGPVAIALYCRTLPVMEKKQMSAHMKQAMQHTKDLPPTALQNAIAVFHCGAGCSIGDLVAGSLVPTLGLSFAGEFASKLVLDFLFAWILGIVFQYATIVPMRGLSFGKGILAAIRADTLSIVLFEIGMFGWMAVSYFLLFPRPHLDPGMAVFWFMMQIAMVAGFFTAFPANAWLIRKGWKEKMPPVDPAQLAPGQAESSQPPSLRGRRPAA